MKLFKKSPLGINGFLRKALLFVTSFICCLFLANPSAAQTEEIDIWDNEEEITCDNITSTFQQYTETFTVSEQAFTKVLINLSNFFQKDPEEITASAESMKQGISEALNTVQSNSLTLSDKGFDILDTMEECLTDN